LANKNPKTKHDPQPSKTPKKAGFDENPLRLRPAWRIGALEMVDPFGWHVLNEVTLHEIREKLRNFESMTLSELVGPKKSSHMVDVDQLCKDARDRLAELHLDDIEQLLSLRLTGRKRVWGILEHNVVILLWWDPNHLVCPGIKD
jgi:hypothetical protein